MYERKGVALIIAVGVLAILAIIVTYFATNMRLELRASRNYNNEIKAKYLAEAGIERAIAELKYNNPEGARFSAIDSVQEGWYAGFLENLGAGNYTVTITDCASQLYINDANPRIGNMFRNLNTALGSPLTAANCTDIIANAPYLTKEQIKTVFDIGDGKYNNIRNHITVNAYVDPNVIDPHDITIPYALQPRAPINVNTAAQPVLEAVFMGLRADNVCPQCNGDGKINIWTGPGTDIYGDCPACPDPATGIGTGDLVITDAEAQALAIYIIGARPYGSWSQFYNALQNAQALGYIGRRDADLIMANCNPNMGLAPGVRNFSWAMAAGYLGKYVDVTDANHGLTASTTELCFNSGGYYEITSTGTVVSAAGVPQSTITINTVVRIFEIIRESSQAEFETGTKNNLITYPEPTGAGLGSAGYDGQIMLQTKTTTDPGTATRMRISFNNTFEPDTKSGASGVDTTQTSMSSSSVVDLAAPGNLLPDGALITKRRNNKLSYAADNNVDRLEGTVSMWIKPMFNNDDSMGYGDVDPDRMMFKVRGGPPGRFQPLWNKWFRGLIQVWFWHALGGGCGGYIIVGAATPEEKIILKPGPGRIFEDWRAGQWHHIAFHYRPPIGYVPGNYETNMGSWLDNGHHNICVDLRYATSMDAFTTEFNTDYYPELFPFDSSSIIEVGWDSQFSDQQINAVLDEIRIWGGTGGFLTVAAMQAGYNEGRYITTGGDLISSAVTKPANSEWGTISWTEYDPDATDPLQFNVGSSPYLHLDLSNDGKTGGDGYGYTASYGVSIPNAYDVSDDLYYHVEFETQTAPLLDTAVFDDVIITHLPPTEIIYKRYFN
ncbi:MAG: hypothetical protein ABH952_09130 [Candidatus Omnitrophota bacterium]